MTESQLVFPPDERPFGIYIHVPFCVSRCDYCGFATNIYDPARAEAYVASVPREMQLWSDEAGRGTPFVDQIADSIYIGGGTPSLLTADQIDRLLQACRSCFRVDEDPEITIEINPATTDRNTLRRLMDCGVNRAGLGIQSLQDTELQRMGRPHSAHDAIGTFEDLRACGFQNISVDLIAGYPGQSVESFIDSLTRAVDLEPEHVSVYLLEVKPGTRLERLLQQESVPPIDDDAAADMYDEVVRLAEREGYEQYEISNFARPGCFSQHNLKYWTDVAFLGLGPAAHGMTGRSRYANLEDLTQYAQELAKGRLPLAHSDVLTPKTRFKEALMMGLRLVKGVDLVELGNRYAVDAVSFVRGIVADLSESDLVTLHGDRLALTHRGRLLSNTIFSRLI